MKNTSFCSRIGAVVFSVFAVHLAQAGDTRDHLDQKLGVEVNVLWPFPPFKTYEVKLRGKLGHGVEAVVGYGRQAWTYTGKRHNQGTIHSHALLLGSRVTLFNTNASIEYTAWLCKDLFQHVNGQTYRGFSYANEFYLGYAYYFPNTNAYILPQWNAGFYSYKSYAMPLNDNYVFDFLPKVSLGLEF